jgi:hypothetical protein
LGGHTSKKAEGLGPTQYGGPGLLPFDLLLVPIREVSRKGRSTTFVSIATATTAWSHTQGVLDAAVAQQEQLAARSLDIISSWPPMLERQTYCNRAGTH